LKKLTLEAFCASKVEMTVESYCKTYGITADEVEGAIKVLAYYRGLYILVYGIEDYVLAIENCSWRSPILEELELELYNYGNGDYFTNA